MFLPLIVWSVLSVGPTQLGAREVELAIVRGWIGDVLDHQPGVIDKPLLDVAAESPDHLDIVRARLRAVLKVEPVRTRNDILRRGALVHTDIALLLPERAAEYPQTDARDRFIFNFNQFEKPRLVNRGDAGRLVTSVDGEYVASEVENAHWSMARGLLHDIYPHPSADEFVQRWYRAVAALFEESYLLGNAKYHLTRALEELPHDPMILLYAGAMHEAYASEGVQSIPKTRPGLLRLPSSREEWSLAEPLLREAVKAGAPVEARLRHARVLGRLGKHAEAAAMLRLLEPRLTDPRLKYFAALFLGSEEGALGDVGQARDAFERAAVLCPTAQAPLVAMADLLRRSGNRTAVLAVLGRIQGLPSDPADRVDPWVDYFRSFALDSADQVDAVRAWVNRKEPR